MKTDKLEVIEKTTSPEVKEKQEENVQNTMSSLCAPSLMEREALTKVYESILTAEITPESAKKAHRCRLDLVAARGKISKSAKAEREYSVAYQKLVIAWEKRVLLPITNMESKLLEIEKHQEILDQEIKDKLANERTNELNKYDVENIPAGLGEMEEETYGFVLTGAKRNFIAKKEAEKKEEEERIENKRLDELELSRKNQAHVYRQFWGMETYGFRTMIEEEFKTLMTYLEQKKVEFEEEEKAKEVKEVLYLERKEKLYPFFTLIKMDSLTIGTTESEFELMLSNAKLAKDKRDKERAEIIKKNERLEKEAKEQEAKAEQERQKALKEEAERKKKEAEAQRIRNEELAKERAKIRRFEDEEKERQIATERRLKAEADAKRAESLAPDKTKLLTMLEKMVMTIPELENEESKDIAQRVQVSFQNWKNMAAEEFSKLK